MTNDLIIQPSKHVIIFGLCIIFFFHLIRLPLHMYIHPHYMIAVAVRIFSFFFAFGIAITLYLFLALLFCCAFHSNCCCRLSVFLLYLIIITSIIRKNIICFEIFNFKSKYEHKTQLSIFFFCFFYR